VGFVANLNMFTDQVQKLLQRNLDKEGGCCIAVIRSNQSIFRDRVGSMKDLKMNLASLKFVLIKKANFNGQPSENITHVGLPWLKGHRQPKEI